VNFVDRLIDYELAIRALAGTAFLQVERGPHQQRRRVNPEVKCQPAVAAKMACSMSFTAGGQSPRAISNSVSA